MNETTTPTPQADSSGSSFSERTKLTFSWIVELLTIFGLLGFLGSILLNEYVFSHWGLSFLQIASLSDVIMSGIQLSIDVAQISLLAGAGYALGRILFDRRPTYAKLRDLHGKVRLFETIRFSSAAVIFTATPLALIAALVVGVSNIKFLMMIAFGLGYVAGNFNFAKFFRSKISRVLIFNGVLWISVIALLVYIYIQAFLSPDSVIGGGVERGFVSQYRTFRMAPRVTDCRSATVLWIGERAIVSRCDQSSRIVVLANGENILFF